nr:16S rRNA (guanine(527)-N(7))-methyltransferase RsmG [uncultured Sphingomonas sp.]
MIERISQVAKCDVSRETYGKLENYVSELLAESERQNLISPTTREDVWERHVVDGAQLVGLAQPGSWVDVGSGAGLPGLVIAILTDAPVTLVEPRRLRVDFLQRCAQSLGLDNVAVVCTKAERAAGHFDNITARAVASLDKLLGITHHLAHNETKWLLPKGQKAQSELEEARRNWQGRFSLVESATNPDASIIVASELRPRGKR